MKRLISACKWPVVAVLIVGCGTAAVAPGVVPAEVPDLADTVFNAVAPTVASAIPGGSLLLPLAYGAYHHIRGRKWKKMNKAHVNAVADASDAVEALLDSILEASSLNEAKGYARAAKRTKVVKSTVKTTHAQYNVAQDVENYVNGLQKVQKLRKI